MSALRAIAATVVALLLATIGAAAHAELRALLVGVSGYPTLPERYRLEGPRNDVELMRKVLRERGFAAERIETLADGVAGAAMPTRANIFAALGRLADAARPGDIVFIHFAGHGSQEPADLATPEGRREPDGLHETFLPIDIGAWNGGTRKVANAIVNHELRAAVDAIGARGAFVWAVFDSCHSATLVRGGRSGELRYRHVDPQDLGIRAEDLERASSASSARRGSAAPVAPLGPTPPSASAATGGSAFFYAAQTSELTPELPLPAGSAGRKRHGLFSFVVARALESAQPMTYRQLAQYVLAEYGTTPEAIATPLFAGNGLDTMVLGQRSVPVRQWPLQAGGARLAIAAGSLSGLDVGAVLAIVPGALSRSDEAIGHVEVAAVEADRAELVPIAFAGRAAPSPAAVPAASFARLVQGASRFALRVAVQTRGCPRPCALADAAALLRRQGVTGVDAAWVDAPADADIVLQQTAEQIVFLPPSSAGDDLGTRAQAPGIALREASRPWPVETLAARIGDGLHAVARERNLLRVVAQLAAGAPSGALRATLQRRPGAAGALQPVTADAVPALKEGDGLVLTIENGGATALDVTVLYLDADHGITALFPNRQGESNRLEPGAHKLVDDITIHAPPAGIERLLLIAVEARRLGERADFSFLQQAALTVRRGGAAASEPDVFADAVFAEFRSRGAVRPAAPRQGTSTQLFTLQVGR